MGHMQVHAGGMTWLTQLLTASFQWEESRFDNIGIMGT